MIQEGVDWNGSVLGLYNTCWWATYSQYFALNCGDDAESYYEEFDYNEGGFRILKFKNSEIQLKNTYQYI